MALDSSSRMLEQARQRLTDRLDQADLVQADLEKKPLPIQPANAASSATFHWIADHRAGARNVASVRQAIQPFARSFPIHGTSTATAEEADLTE